MPLLVRRAVIACKIETNEAVDAMSSPGTADAGTQLVVINPQVQVVPDEINRDIVVQHLSPLGFVVGARYAQLTFSTEWRGRGAVPTAASPLRDNALFIGCATSPSYSAGSAVYRFNSAMASSPGLSTATIYAFIDGVLHILRGCRGNLDINAQSGRFGLLNWSFQGVYTALAANGPAASAGIYDSPNPAGSFDNFSLKPPAVLGCQFQSHGFSATIQQFTLNFNNAVERREDLTAGNGYAGTLIGNRLPEGTIDPEAVLRATHDFWQRWQNGTTGLIDLVVGSSVGNQMRARIPQAQYHRPQWATRGNKRTYAIPYQAVAQTDTGDDEMELHFL